MDPIDLVLKSMEKQRESRWDMELDSTCMAKISDFFREVGSLHKHCTLDNYEVDPANEGQGELLKLAKGYSERLWERFEDGTNIFLRGNPGAGKDHILMALSKDAFRAGAWVKWSSGAEIRRRCRDEIGSDNAGSYVGKLKGADILWISDPTIDNQPASAFQKEVLYDVLDHRTRKKYPTWVSMNAATAKHATDLVGPQVYDRIRFNAVCHVCRWGSYREPRSPQG